MRTLPRGHFVQITRLPFGTSEEELSDWFYSIGWAIDPEFISVQDFVHNAGALISIQDDLVLELFNYGMQRQKFGECEIFAVQNRRRT
jgi:hypothetical protein